MGYVSRDPWPEDRCVCSGLHHGGTLVCRMECLQAFCSQGRWYNNLVLEYSHSINRVKVRAMYEERTYVEWHVSLSRGESLLYCGQQELHGVVRGGFLLEALPGEGATWTQMRST